MSVSQGRDRPLSILAISNLLPYPPNTGGITRLYNIYNWLGKKHHVTWVSPIWEGTGQYVPEAERFCERVIPLSPSNQMPFPNRGWRYLLFRAVAPLHWERLFVYCFGYVEAPGIYWLPPSPERLALVNEIAASSKFDLVICEFEGNAEVVPTGNDVPKVVVLHNTLSTLFKRIREMYGMTRQDWLFYWPELWKIMAYEKRVYSRYNLGIVTSELDRHLLKKRCPNLPSEIIPNGVDASDFCPTGDAGSDKQLMYLGHYGYPPNADAILYFSRTIWPLIRQKIPDVETMVIGHQPPQELSDYEGVRVIGTVPDVRPYLAQAGVVITPLRVGGGTRLKILEALAMCKAVVSTTLGAEGLNATHGHDIMLADTPQAFAECVVRLLQDPDLRLRLGQNGRKLVEREYNWDIITAKLERALYQVVNDHKRGKHG
jgi:glycosyltransferase involved in cell wall biosynthesis